MQRPLVNHVPIGYRRDGRPVWQIAGGADGDPPATPPGTPPADPPKDDPPKTFDQAAVDRIVADRLARDREKYADVPALREKAKKFDEIEAANATDLDKAVKAAREEGKAEVRTAADARLVKAEARALAAEAKFRNPTLAVSALDLSTVKVAEDGSVDGEAIKQLLTALSTSDPYLIDDGKPKPPGFDGGVRQTDKTSGKDVGRAEAEKRFGPKVGAQQ